MSSSVTITVDGEPLATEAGTTVAAALWNAGRWGLRSSVRGQPRGVLCAMGVCFECRVTVDGVSHQRACTTLCLEGMKVTTGSGERE